MENEMKFKMIAGCLAAGLGMVSVGAHAGSMECKPEEKVSLLLSTTTPYKLRQFSVGYRLTTPGCGRIPEEARKFEVTLEADDQGTIPVGRVPKRTYFNGTLAPSTENKSLVVEVLKGPRAGGGHPTTYYQRYATDTSSYNGSGPILKGQLPTVNSSEGMRVAITAPKPSECEFTYLPGSTEQEKKYQEVMQMRDWHKYGPRYCLDPIDPIIKFTM